MDVGKILPHKLEEGRQSENVKLKEKRKDLPTHLDEALTPHGSIKEESVCRYDVEERVLAKGSNVRL